MECTWEGARRPAGRRDWRDDRAGRLFAVGKEEVRGEGGNSGWDDRLLPTIAVGEREAAGRGRREPVLRANRRTTPTSCLAHVEAHLFLPLESGVSRLDHGGGGTVVEVFTDRPMQPRPRRGTSCRCGAFGRLEMAREKTFR